MLKGKAVKYCRYCGQELVENRDGCPEECPYKDDPYAFCPNCGDQLADDSTYCSCDGQD